MLTKVLSQEKIIEIFGDFHPFLDIEGKPSLDWERQILTKILLPSPLPLAWNKSVTVSTISCHKLIANFLRGALTTLYDLPEVWNTINDYGGVYNFRTQRRSIDTLSRHCWAIAIDLDVGDNPFGRNPQVHPKTVEIFQSYGFEWGGNFSGKRKDGQHFEFVDLERL